MFHAFLYVNLINGIVFSYYQKTSAFVAFCWAIVSIKL